MKIGNKTINTKYILSFEAYPYPQYPQFEVIEDEVRGLFGSVNYKNHRCSVCGTKSHYRASECSNPKCKSVSNWDTTVLTIEYLTGRDTNEVDFDSEDLTRTQYDEAIKKLEALDL